VLLAIPATDTNHIDENGNNALLFAIKSGAEADQLKRFMDLRISAFDTDNRGNTALHACLMVNRPSAMETAAVLVKYAGDLVALTRNGDGKLPLETITWGVGREIAVIFDEYETRARTTLRQLLQDWLLPPLAQIIVALL
jgi:hypothetical protein